MAATRTEIWRKARASTRIFLKDPESFLAKHTKPPFNAAHFEMPMLNVNIEETLRICTRFSEIARALYIDPKVLNRLKLITECVQVEIRVQKKQGHNLKAYTFEAASDIKRFIGQCVSRHSVLVEGACDKYMADWALFGSLCYASTLRTLWHPEQLCWNILFHLNCCRSIPRSLMTTHISKMWVLPWALGRYNAAVAARQPMDPRFENLPDIRLQFRTDQTWLNNQEADRNPKCKNSAECARQVRKRLKKKQRVKQCTMHDFFQRNTQY